MNWKQVFQWSQDINTRNKALADFAVSIGASVKDGAYVWANGRYLLLHFDLLTKSPQGNIQRSQVYENVNDVVRETEGTRLTESVYLVPLLPEKTSECCAAMFWNELREYTAGKLKPGDTFYIHFAPDVKDLQGGLAHVVAVGSDTLMLADLPL